MLRKYLFFIGLRYLKAKRQDHFISVISLISILGIALGVAVLITVLSVMNGFSKEIRAKILQTNPHITLKDRYAFLSEWRGVVAELKKITPIIGVAPYISGHGLLDINGYSKPVMIMGIDLSEINNVYSLQDHVIKGDSATILAGKNTKFNMLIGQDLCESMGLNLNDRATLIFPGNDLSLTGFAPKFKQLTVGGIFKTNTVYDHNYIFISIADAARLYKTHGISGIQMKTNNPLTTRQIMAQINAKFDYKYLVTDWTMDFGAWLDAIKMEKTVMSCILLLIISVASFNLIASLIMLVMEKKKDIAILQVMGATCSDIMLIFMIQGTAIGLIGTMIGLLVGLILSYNITYLVDCLQQVFNIKFVLEQAYWIGFLPSDPHVKDIIWICSLSIIMSLLATIYPAYRASNIKPAEALRYE